MTKVTSKTTHAHSYSALETGAVYIGTIIRFDSNGKPLVDFADNPNAEPQVALSTQALSAKHLSRQVALLFNGGDLTQPVIMGLIHNPLDELLENFELTPASIADDIDPFEGQQKLEDVEPANSKNNDEPILVDGKKVCIEGAEEIVFKCGKASITLTKSGKILIKGTYLLNRSSGVNRIMGGSVQVN